MLSAISSNRTTRSFFFFVLLPLYLIVLFLTQSDYGITHDNALGEIHLGDRYLNFYGTFDWEHLDFSKKTVDIYQHPNHPDFHALSDYARRRPHHIWPVGPMLSSASKYVLFGVLGWLNAIDAHNISAGLTVTLLLIGMYLFCERYISGSAALIAVTSLVVYPPFWAHLHNNLKDVPSTVFLALTIMSFVGGIFERRTSLLLLSGVFSGLSLATKPNALFLPIILGPCLLLHLWHRGRGSLKPISSRELFVLISLPVLSSALFFLLWPLLWLEFPNNLLNYYEYLFARGMSGPDHWKLEPLFLFVGSMPPVIMLLSAIGLSSLLRKSMQDERSRELFLLLLMWTAVPVLRVSIPKAYSFDLIRHWMEYIPAIAISAGIGGGLLYQKLKQSPSMSAAGRAPLLLVLLFAPTVFWNIENHPYQVVYFNDLVGGLAGVKQAGVADATDFWASSYRKGTEWMNQNAPQGSVLFVGVAQHVVSFSKSLTLRPDITLRPIRKLNKAYLKRNADRPVYLMYVTREHHYRSRLLRRIAKHSPPKKEVVVGNVPILRIHELTKLRR